MESLEQNGVQAGGRASDRIEHELRRMIVTLELAPGAEVSEPYLIERLKCGRTPLREALQRLAQEHLVVSVPRRGTSIAELSVSEFRELEEVRGLVPRPNGRHVLARGVVHTRPGHSLRPTIRRRVRVDAVRLRPVLDVRHCD